MTSVNTHPRDHSLRGDGQCQRCLQQKSCARLNTCRSRPVSARCTRCRCFKVCSCVTLPSQVHRRQTLSTSSSRSERASLVSSVKTRHISWSSSQGRLRSKVCACVQKVAGASSDRWGYGAPAGQRRLPGRGDNVFVHASHSHHKTSRFWTLAQDIILEWEQRKRRTVGGGAPCKSRKTHALVLRCRVPVVQ